MSSLSSLIQLPLEKMVESVTTLNENIRHTPILKSILIIARIESNKRVVSERTQGIREMQTALSQCKHLVWPRKCCWRELQLAYNELTRTT